MYLKLYSECCDKLAMSTPPRTQPHVVPSRAKSYDQGALMECIIRLKPYGGGTACFQQMLEGIHQCSTKRMAALGLWPMGSLYLWQRKGFEGSGPISPNRRQPFQEEFRSISRLRYWRADCRNY